MKFPLFFLRGDKMANYQSAYTGAQIDAAVGAV
jgi:hypothetical protein